MWTRVRDIRFRCRAGLACLLKILIVSQGALSHKSEPAVRALEPHLYSWGAVKARLSFCKAGTVS